MKYSLFRSIDVFEMITIYIVCFTSNLVFMYVDTLNLEVSSVLESFLESITEYRLIINILLTCIAIVFHYQFLDRRKNEVFCRILVGDTMINVIARYILNSLAILTVSFLLSLSLNFYLGLNITSNLYLAFIFIIYILLSVGWVKKS